MVSVVEPGGNGMATFSVSVRTMVLAGCILSAIVPAALLVPVFQRSSAGLTEGLIAENLRVRAQFVAAELARGLHAHWREIEATAGLFEEGLDPGQNRQVLDRIAMRQEKYAWVGLAAPDGKVLAATRGLLEGQDVGQRPWFRAGLQAPFAGDVHEALLLQKLLQPNSAEPMRFVDFATPVRRRDGVFVGVLGAHLDWNWVEALVRGARRDGAIDVMLVSRERLVLIGGEAVQGTTLDLPSLRAAQQGTTRSFVETWPDGVAYLTAIVPTVAHRNLPSFGWSIVVRQPVEMALQPLRGAAQRAALALAAGLLGAVLIGLYVAARLAAPLRRIAAAVDGLAEGSPGQTIPEARAYREVRRIAAALVRLQNRLSREQGGGGASVAPHGSSQKIVEKE